MSNNTFEPGLSPNEIMLESTISAIVSIAICVVITVLIRKFINDRKTKKHYQYYNPAEDESNSVSYTKLTHNDARQMMKKWSVDEGTANRILNFFANGVYKYFAASGERFLVIGRVDANPKVCIVVPESESKVTSTTPVLEEIVIKKEADMLAGSVLLREDVEGISWTTENVKEIRKIFVTLANQ